MLFVVGVGVAARLIMLFLFIPLHFPRAGDGAFYLDAAESLLRSDSYSYAGSATAFRPPGYSAFIALLGGSPLLTVIAQSTLTLCSAVLTYLLLKRRHPVLAITTAILIATSPFLIAYEFNIFSETLYIQLTWDAWLLLYTGRSAPVALLAGAVLGMAILTRDTLLLLPIFALPFALGHGQLLPKLTLALIASSMVVVPWMIRNESIADGAFEISTGRLGYNLWVGTWERDARWMLPGLDHADYPATAFRSANEKRAIMSAWSRQDDGLFRRIAIDRISSAPFATVRTWALRYPRLWIGTRTDEAYLRFNPGSLVWTAAKLFFLALDVLTLILGAIGLALCFRSKLSFFAIPPLYTALVYIPFHNTETRYSLIAFPFIYLFVAAGIVRVALGPGDSPEPSEPSSRRKSRAGFPATSE